MNRNPPRPHIILASASPRRRQILTFAGFTLDIRPTDLDEEKLLGSMPGVRLESAGIFRLPPGLAPRDAALHLAEAKAKAAAAAHAEAARLHPVLAADTIVVVDDLLLAKPHDSEQSCKMLHLLSGQTHEVITAHVLIWHGRAFSLSPITCVTFRELSDDEIDAYVKMGESADKAGAYAIQGEGALLVESVNGDYLNIVGLSPSAVTDLLRESGVV